MIPKWALALVCAVIVGAGAFYLTFTLFVVQPIGAVPDGAVFVIPRTSDLNFIDSADAICERRMGSVSLLCRMTMLTDSVDPDKIRLRLPYQEWLYTYSTNGKSYER